MDRKPYLEMCQKCAMLPDGIMGMKENVPQELRVVHQGIEYYPFGYTLYFANNGESCHAVILHDLKAHSIVHAYLKNVEPVNIDKTN